MKNNYCNKHRNHCDMSGGKDEQHNKEGQNKHAGYSVVDFKKRFHISSTVAVPVLILSFSFFILAVLSGIFLSFGILAPEFFSKNEEYNSGIASSIMSQAEEKKSIPSKLPKNYPTIEFPMDKANERITKKTFGMFITPKTSPIENDKFNGFHTGVDFEIFPDEVEKEIPVKAVLSGKLIMKKDASGYGGVMVQKAELDGETVTVVYGHLDLGSVFFEKEEEVKAGETIGYLGDDKSGETDGARKHLHLSIHKGEQTNIKGYAKTEGDLSDWIDPCLWIF